MYVSNTWPNEVTVKLNFVDGTITNDAEQNKACQPEGTRSKFGKYVTFDNPEFDLPPQKTSELHAKVNFPGGYAGMSYGCVTSQIIGQDLSDGGMFQVLSRRANFIDVLVNGEIKLWLNVIPVTNTIGKEYSSVPEISIYQDPTTDAFKAKIVVHNPGNIAQEVSITPSIQGLFAPLALTAVQTKKVLPGQKASFEIELDEHIPLRKWTLWVSIMVQHTPVFDFQNEDITDAMKRWVTKTYHASMLLIPWNYLLILAIILIILWIVTWRKKPAPEEKKKTTKKITKKSPTKKSSPRSKK